MEQRKIRKVGLGLALLIYCRYLCLEIVEKNEQICTVKFQNFLGAMPQTPILGRGYGAPTQTPLPSALRRFAPPCLARGLRPLRRPSLCVVDILIYFRPWSV